MGLGNRLFAFSEMAIYGPFADIFEIHRVKTPVCEQFLDALPCFREFRYGILAWQIPQ